MKKIKILMSTYNGEKYIDEQLNSLYNQTTDAEISLVIRDDGSTDHTLDIVESWKDRLEIVLIQENINLGPAKSFWRLLHLAGDADYYAFCDQDDYWKADKMERALGFVGDTSEASLYFSNAEFVDENTQPLGKVLFNKPIDVNLYRIMAVNCALGCTIVFNKAAHAEFVSSPFNAIEMHDKAAVAIAYLLGNVVYDDEPSIMYRQHSNNVLGRKNKSIKKRLMQTYKLWFCQKEFSLDKQAEELLAIYQERISAEDIECLRLFSTYKYSGNSRIRILFSDKLNMERLKLSFTFKLRIIMGRA